MSNFFEEIAAFDTRAEAAACLRSVKANNSGIASRLSLGRDELGNHTVDLVDRSNQSLAEFETEAESLRAALESRAK